jgi:hypothetical protein
MVFLHRVIALGEDPAQAYEAVLKVWSPTGVNLDYPAWYALFDNKPLVDALLDRLQHHCITIRIDGPSLRASTAGQATAAPASAPKTRRNPTPATQAQPAS